VRTVQDENIDKTFGELFPLLLSVSVNEQRNGHGRLGVSTGCLSLLGIQYTEMRDLTPLPQAVSFVGYVTVQFGDTLLPFYSEDWLMNQVTSWTILLDKQTVAQLLNKFPIFYGTWKFITSLQQPASGPYPEANDSSPSPPIPFKIHFNIILPSMSSRPFDLFPLGFQPKL
jgi:hypothetical protein